LLVAQAAFLLHRRTTFDDIEGPKMGQVFPSLEVQFVGRDSADDLGEQTVEAGRCVFVVFMDVNCSVCGRMRFTWAGRFRAWSDSAQLPIRAIWAFSDQADRISAFVAGHDVAGIDLATVTDARRGMRELGVFGTPIAYLINAKGQAKLGVAGNQFPPASVAAKACQT
jgi:hypothetical protein